MRVHPGETVSVPGQPPAWYDARSAELRIDAGRVLVPGVDDPRRVDLATATGRARHPVLVGVVLQLAARAAHSDPSIRFEGDPWSGALEAARTQRLLVADQATARQFLRAAGRHQVSTALRGGAMADAHPWLLEAALVLGLADAGVLAGADVGGLRRDLTTLLGTDRTARMEGLVARAVALDDHSQAGLVAIARELEALLDSSPDAPSDAVESAAAALDTAAADALATVHAASEGPTPAPRDPVTAARRHHAQNAHRTAYRQGRSEIDGTMHREPSEPLRREARSLARTLRAAIHPHTATEVRASTMPPGRLRLSEAMRAESQHARAVPVTAKPWRQLRRVEPLDRSLKVGLSWDVSRSRSTVHERACEAAWALAWASRIVGASFSAVAWNSAPSPVVWPSRVPTMVAYPPCHGASSGCAQSLRALDGALGLSESIGTRVVVVVSDGALPNRRHVEAEVAELVASGVRVVWLSDSPDSWSPGEARHIAVVPGASVVPGLTDVLAQALSEEG